MGRLATVTVTGFLGPDREVTSLVFNNSPRVDFQLEHGVVEITKEDQTKQQFDLEDTTGIAFSSFTASSVAVAIVNT